MNHAQFSKILEDQLHMCSEVLDVKAHEYATEDRLHNFKIAAELEGVTVRQALAGMMAKHTVSVYDMCKSPVPSAREQWDEKITDHINYLILLRAVIHEEAHNRMSEESAPLFPMEG